MVASSLNAGFRQWWPAVAGAAALTFIAAMIVSGSLPESQQLIKFEAKGVMQVAPEGPCAKAGVLAGDILVAVDGAPASRPRQIARQFGPASIGKEVELRVIRSGAPRTLTATITARPEG